MYWLFLLSHDISTADSNIVLFTVVMVMICCVCY